ncbi:putative helicase mov-10-B.1 isoform X1 [Hypomesus transpacificus]|uniref:putative helicase mov-10-B.1 isoform X1 n=2 Tax=Hypomesus transpacificus TaxID=137520 RepID=UPI001F07A1CE|nr:putative helicase mov-10-B.1 isoform X1 [Hypomesus transpacificus]XP_046881376.1 putative helicase mov-10-B.1 isoform X1 [Hypomesus transpacificus]
MPSLQDCLESGLDFVEFLGKRTSKTNKKELRDIYNLEFKNRDGYIYPNFSTVIYALQKFNKAYIKKGKLHINVESQVRVYYGDQWRRPRGGQKGSPGTATPHVAGGARSSTPSPGSYPAHHPDTLLLTPKKRLAKEVLNTLKMNRKELTSDKGGIVMTSDPAVTEGKIHVSVGRLGQLFAVKFHILNEGKGSVQFTLYTALHRMSCFTLLDERRVTRTSPLLLSPGESYKVEVQYRLHHYGHFPATMYFEFFPDRPGSKPFCILREMEAWARGALGVELGPVEPYRPYQVAIRRPVNTVIVEGERPESSVVHRLRPTVKLGDYIYPLYLKDLSRQNMEDSEYLSNAARQKLPSVRALLFCPLRMKNYSQRFHLLLHLEEIQMEVDIRRYDLRGQTMTQDHTNKKLLILRVPGVAENRPSVLRGDCLKVSRAEEKVQPITVYTGYVYRVQLDRVKMGFSKRLLQFFLSNMKFDVEFTLNRYPLKLQHRAVDLATLHRLDDLLFPRASASTETPLPKLRMFNRQLEDNPEQYAVIQRIVAGASKPAPYLVFGPPGTGKTITLVEAMTQVDRADPKAHILACAPSNSAADLLCERLLGHLDPHRVHRLYASSRAPGTVPKHLLRHCNWDATQDCFVLPAKKVLMQYKVLVTTLVTAGRLVSGGVPAGHFSHVFVDEAGQAVEPECVIAVAGLLRARGGQLVLAGDPQQLGPILRSPLALQHGLGLSLLERLMKHNSLYQKTGELGHYNSRFVTKLLRNYRSHPAILKIPNQLFYDNELQVFADQWERDTYRNWEYLPKKGFPVIFHGVMGKDEREANSPSFFNVSEIEVLVDYLTKLMQTQGKKGLPKLSPRDIGIIAPYRKQVEKIQKALKSVKELNQWNDIQELKVGSVEEFQGQERKIVMVTTVRSSINYVKMDQDFNIGFLANEKRFNVAMTRAKALLIVVGNPVILNKDPTWERFIRYCVDNEGYTGFNHADAEGEDDVVSRLASLKIHVQSESEQPACDGESDESRLQQFINPEWRDEH